MKKPTQKPQFFNEIGDNITEKLQGKKIYPYEESYEASKDADKIRSYAFPVFSDVKKFIKPNANVHEFGWRLVGHNLVGYAIAK